MRRCGIILDSSEGKISLKQDNQKSVCFTLDEERFRPDLISLSETVSTSETDIQEKQISNQDKQNKIETDKKEEFPQLQNTELLRCTYTYDIYSDINNCDDLNTKSNENQGSYTYSLTIAI